MFAAGPRCSIWWGPEMVSDEQFFAWLDGELSPDEAKQVQAEVAADPKLTALAEQHRSMQVRLKGAFDTILEAPVPERVRPADNVVDFAAATTNKAKRSWSGLPQWAALAATLAIGIVVGTVIPQRSVAPVEVEGSKLYAASALDQSLDTQLASAPSNGAVKIGITYRDRVGSICRTFTETQSSGLACRNGGRWQVRGLFAAPEGQSAAYRMAAGMDPNLAALVDSTISGEAFDAAQEKAARDGGWKMVPRGGIEPPTP